MITNELNLFISYKFYFMPLQKCIICNFLIYEKLKLKRFRQIQLISLWNKMEKMTFFNINVLYLLQLYVLFK